jgi:superfamily II DNA or RNA helicase
MNRLKSYEKIVSERGIKAIPYQRDFLVNNEEFPKPNVFAGGTSSGKTITTAIWLEMFYQNPSNKGKRTLLIPASTTVLRDNMGDTFDMFNPKFTYCVCRNAEELKASIKADCDVILCLPQTLVGSISELKHFHNFILDEAHQWYFQKTVTQILTKVKPNNQLLLTGTPSKFIAKGNKFDFTFVPVMELYELGLVSNVKIKVVSSSYNPSQSDYRGNYGSLTESYKLTDTDNSKSLKMVCKEMITKLGSNNSKLSSNPLSVLGEIDKTIIFCHSQNQANQFHNILSKTKELKGKVLISHSEIDKDSVLFSEFKSDNTKKVLIAVNRGKLGFSMGELFNIIDFTLTQNIDMLLQMYGRVLRLSKHNPTKEKIYYKVATKDTAGYFVDLMTAMLCLTNMEWYSKYNGKNMGGMIVPKVLNRKGINQSPTNRTKSKSVKQYVSIEDLGIPLDLSFLKSVSSYKDTDRFGTVAECTLDDVRREFFDIRAVSKPYSIEEIKEAISKCTKLRELQTNYSFAYSWVLTNNREDLISHLERSIRERITLEEVKESISKCSTVKEFKANYNSSYCWCNRNKRKDLYKHLSKAYNCTPFTYSLEEVKSNISKCSTVKEFKIQYKTTYIWCKNNGRKDLYIHLQTRKVHTKLTLEEVKEAISKCSTITELRKESKRAYSWCINNNRKDLLENLNPSVLKRGITIDKVTEAISKCSTFEELQSKYNWALRWCYNNRRKDLYEHLNTNSKLNRVEEFTQLFKNWSGNKTSFVKEYGNAARAWAVRGGVWEELTKHFTKR